MLVELQCGDDAHCGSYDRSAGRTFLITDEYGFHSDGDGAVSVLNPFVSQGEVRRTCLVTFMFNFRSICVKYQSRHNGERHSERCSLINIEFESTLEKRRESFDEG